MERGGVGLEMYVSVLGLSPAATYRLVASATPCGSKNATLASLATLTGARDRSFIKDVLSKLPDGVDPLASVRMIRTKPTRAQVACGPAIPHTFEEGIGDPYGPADAATWMFRARRAKGLAVTNITDADTLSVDMAAWATVGTRHALVGSRTGCNEAHTPADTVFKVRFASRAARFGVLRDGVDALGLESVRVFRGAGFSRQLACSGLISGLQPLP
jgi:hypothetical protein